MGQFLVSCCQKELNMALRMVLKIAVAALLVLGAVQAQNSCKPKECQCKIIRTCSGVTQLHYDFMADEFAARVVGRKNGRNIKKQDDFCENECLNLLKNFLSTDYDHTTRMKPDGVILDDMDYIGHHRICQLADTTEDSCTFTLRSKVCGGSLTERMIGETGCLVFTHTSGSTITLKFATTPGTTMIPYAGDVDYTTFTGANMVTTSFVGP